MKQAENEASELKLQKQESTLANETKLPKFVFSGFTILSVLVVMNINYCVCVGGQVEDEDDEDDEEPAVTGIRAVRHFPCSSWLLFLICAFFYAAIMTFYAVASDIIQNIGAYSVCG